MSVQGDLSLHYLLHLLHQLSSGERHQVKPDGLYKHLLLIPLITPLKQQLKELLQEITYINKQMVEKVIAEEGCQQNLDKWVWNSDC